MKVCLMWYPISENDLQGMLEIGNLGTKSTCRPSVGLDGEEI